MNIHDVVKTPVENHVIFEGCLHFPTQKKKTNTKLPTHLLPDNWPGVSGGNTVQERMYKVSLTKVDGVSLGMEPWSFANGGVGGCQGSRGVFSGLDDGKSVWNLFDWEKCHALLSEE